MQGYPAHKKQPPPHDPTVGLCLGPYGGPGEVGVSCERGTPAGPISEFKVGAPSLLKCVLVQFPHISHDLGEPPRLFRVMLDPLLSEK